MSEGADRVPTGRTAVTDFGHHTELPDTRVSRVVEQFIRWLGDRVSWFWLPLVAVILVSVISRYVFSAGSVTMEEIQWHLSSVAWLIGLSYAFISDNHVRVDVIHERLSLRGQAWIELLGLLLMAMPFLAIGVYMTWPYFHESFLQGEVSQAPAGLPFRWALKFTLLLAFVLLLLAAFARLLRCSALLFGWPVPRPRAPANGERTDTAP